MTAWGILFPLDVVGWTSKPTFRTDITTGINGREVRNALYEDPIRHFYAKYGVKTIEDVRTLYNFFLVVKGPEQSFLVKDYLDHSLERTTIGTGDGVTTNFQLIKVYENAVVGDYVRRIEKPKQIEGGGGVRVWVNNVELADTDFAFSSVTGIITLSSAPANGHVVEASCDEFYVPCRFEQDELPIELLTYWVANNVEHSVTSCPDIPLKEVIGE